MEAVDPLRFVFAFLFVVGLIGIMGFAMKRYGRGNGLGMVARKGEEGRLRVVETRYLDPKRRLVLVRRDDTEHLLLLADGRELVIESGVVAVKMDAG
jgi:flagellar protein FliO/FliZ